MYNFKYTYFYTDDGISITTGTLSGYKKNDIYYRIKYDTVFADNKAYYHGTECVNNVNYKGCNYPTDDSSFTDSKFNADDLNSRVGLYRPNYIFSVEEFRNTFNDSNRYSITINTIKDFYLIVITDTNTLVAPDLELVVHKDVVKYTISRKDYSVHRQFWYSDFSRGGVMFHDSSEFIFNYSKKTASQIISYVNSFRPFKKLSQEITIYPQDTISVFPEFTLQDTLNIDYVSSKSKSRYTLVEFWYKSCAPCLQNMRRLNAVRDSISRSLLEIVAINDQDLYNTELLGFVRKFKPNYTILFNGHILKDKINISAHPTTYIFDNQNRRVIYYEKGTGVGYTSDIIQFIRHLRS